MTTPEGTAGRDVRWALAVALPAVAFVSILCVTLAKAPYPLSETVGFLEDVANRPAYSFLIPTRAYYRPLFNVSLWAIWHLSASVESALVTNTILLHIVPIVLVTVLFLVHLRPLRAVDAAAAMVALSVLFGAAATLDNLELLLSQTLVGMLAALAVWMLLEREHRRWHGPAIIGLTLLAIGFKEQGLVIVPLVAAAVWAGAPGARRTTAVAVVSIAAAYVSFRMTYGPAWQPFEQDVGFGFQWYSSGDAERRFGEFPLGMYAYNAASTISNVLFAEPTAGVFRIVGAWISGERQPWHAVYVGSSVFLTALVLWWGVASLRRVRSDGWSPEARLALATGLALAACGVLSFNYSRDRLGGMAVPFYALAAFHAIRATTVRAAAASRPVACAAVPMLMVLAGCWQLRAVYTIEFTGQRSLNSQREWLTQLHNREVEFADRPTYLRIMREMTDQGTAPNRVARTRYPPWLMRLLGDY